MCMDIEYSGEDKEQALKNIKDQRKFYKSVVKHPDEATGYQSLFRRGEKGGTCSRSLPQNVEFSEHGGYAWLNLEQARHGLFCLRPLLGAEIAVLEVSVEPEDIVAIGQQNGFECIRVTKMTYLREV